MKFSAVIEFWPCVSGPFCIKTGWNLFKEATFERWARSVKSERTHFSEKLTQSGRLSGSVENGREFEATFLGEYKYKYFLVIQMRSETFKDFLSIHVARNRVGGVYWRRNLQDLITKLGPLSDSFTRGRHQMAFTKL
jgi:hypothetical protein